MPTCKKCFIYFPNRIIIDNKVHNLSKRLFCLNCSPFKRHNTRNLTLVNKSIEEIYGTTKECYLCKKILPIDCFYKTKGMKRLNSYCKECFNKINIETINKRKIKCVEYKGSKCSLCSYDKYIGALEFHHVDPRKKDFYTNRITMMSFDKIKKELDKCLLLCSNCHREVQAGVTKIPDSILRKFNLEIPPDGIEPSS